MTAAWLWSPFQAILGIIFPFAVEGDGRTARIARWALHAAIWATFFGLLWQFERSPQFHRWLRSSIPAAHSWWLLMLGIASYLVGWLGWCLWHALSAETPIPRIEDLDEAWANAAETLAHSGIRFDRIPTFFVLGSTPTALSDLLAQWGLRPTSPKTHLPFHVYANHDAVLIFTDRLGCLGSVGESDARRFASSQTFDENDATTNRLAHLCRLVATRCSTPAIQGALVVVPWEATRTESNTLRTIDNCQKDLGAIRKASGLEFPIYLAIANAEDHSPKWCGFGCAFEPFPPLPDLDPEDIGRMWQIGVDRLCLETIPMRLLQLKAPNATGADGVLAYQLVAELHARRARIAKLLTESTRCMDGETGFIGGLCLLASDRTPSDVSALAKTLWIEMLGYRDVATWNAETLDGAENERRQLSRRYALGTLGTVLAFSVAMAILAWRE